jgi:EmrB/QacA subfamily drug resistance transporter
MRMPFGRLDQKWGVLIAIGVGTFMSALDGSVVNTVLPVLNEAFGSDVSTIEWVVTVYLLIVSGLLLSVGRLGDLRGHKRVYLVGFGVFIFASALNGLAPSALVLIVTRGFQAFGAAMLFANSPAILTKNFPPEQRGQALGLQATMTYLGLTAGPSIGGWLADALGWRSVFYINVPVGAVAMLLSYRFIPDDVRQAGEEGFDLRGAGLFNAGLVALLLGLNQGHEWGWTSLPVLGLTAVALVLLTAFVRTEARVPNPMLDLELFRKRSFSAATVSAIINYMCVYGVLFLTPFYLIDGRGFSAAQAGLILTAQPLVMAVAAPFSGTISDRIGTRAPSTLGLAILGCGLWLLSALGPASPVRQIVVALGVAGLGVGIFTSPNSSALMGSAPRREQGIAAAILASARNVGMVLGIGFAGAIFTSILARSSIGLSGPILFPAVRVGYVGTSLLALVGVIVSAARGKLPRQEWLDHDKAVGRRALPWCARSDPDE